MQRYLQTKLYTMTFTQIQSHSQIVNEGALAVSGLLSKKMDANIGSFEIGYFIYLESGFMMQFNVIDWR